MNAVSDAIKAAQKALQNEHVLDCVHRMRVAQDAMAACVAAAETYRKKMISASETGVTALELTREASFIVLGALRSAGAGTVPRACAFSAMEIGAASGAVKTAAGVIADTFAESAEFMSRVLGKVAEAFGKAIDRELERALEKEAA